MTVTERLASRALDSKTGRIMESIRVGWNNYSFIFYIGGISAILGGVFGGAGLLSIVVAVLFFYFAGRFKQHIEREKERRREKEKRNKKHRA